MSVATVGPGPGNPGLVCVGIVSVWTHLSSPRIRGPLVSSADRAAELVVLVTTVPLRRHRHDTGIDDLPATRNVALGARCWSKRSNSFSISPALASFSRNSHNVVASGMLSSIASPKRENDNRLVYAPRGFSGAEKGRGEK